MTDHVETTRPFSVHLHHERGQHAHLVTEVSFEAAALAFVEDHPVTTGDESVVSLIVREVQSGHERCFRIDVETGETAPCS